MNEINEKNVINDNLIDEDNNKKNSYKSFNILKKIQDLLKKESNCKEMCKQIFLLLLLFSY